MFINLILKHPMMWQLSQIVFGSNKQKQKLYSALIKEEGKLLDFGCANGNTFPAFTRFDYTGLDIDCKAIDYASKKYSQYSNVKFICSDILEDKLPAKSFDVILFAATGHHLPNELLFKITESLSRLLKKGGSLYLFDPIKDKSRNSKLLNYLISLDQGKFHKDEKFYNDNLKNFSKDLKPIYHKKFIIKDAYFPQPTCYIAKLTKV